MKTKKDSIIEIKEDVKLPNTEIILEKGDKIQILSEGLLVPIAIKNWVEKGVFNDLITDLIVAEDLTEEEAIRKTLDYVSSALENFIGGSVSISWRM